MKRRTFIQNTGLATLGALTAHSSFGSSKFARCEEEAVSKVHLIFKTHLDIGFTNLAQHVIQSYLNNFIPGALSLAEDLRETGKNNRFIWTTGSWLIYEFLEKADAASRRRMERAIDNNDIAWHGLPFTTHTELADPSLFELGIQLSKKLDNRFGKKTIAAKMTDVPGHTRSLIPILEKNQIEFLHIGVNPASTPPEVPSLFNWQSPDGKNIVVMYQKDYGSQMIIPGTQTAVAISFTGDNHGPQKPQQIAEIYSSLRKQFPNAEIVASTLNNVASEIALIKEELPIIKKEIGDTWIHGVASDPLKVARFKEISRFRQKLLKNKVISFGDKTDLAFGIPLLMVAEHTWGLDVKTWLNDWDMYQPKAFNALRSTDKYRFIEESWGEKRQYITQSISNLPEENKGEAIQLINSLSPITRKQEDLTKVEINDVKFDSKYYQIEFDPNTGSLIKLFDKETRVDWASKSSPLGQFSYQTYSKDDYDRFLSQYLTKRIDWALKDFGKPGLEKVDAESRIWLPTINNSFIIKEADGLCVMVQLAIGTQNGRIKVGCAKQIELEYFFPNKTKEVRITLQWFDKSAYRLPEASWFSFKPKVNTGQWLMNKMGQEVETTDVVKNGNRNLHAINSANFINHSNQCTINSIDAPLVATRNRNILNFDNKTPTVDNGMHFCLHNNVWGTNFMMWFNDDMKYRFVFKT